MNPRRIVSLVPSMTETVCLLGAADRLVGATRYCVEPAAELADVPRIGGTKNPDLEAVADLEPDLILVNSEENRPEHIAALRRHHRVLEHMPRTVPQAAAAVRDLGVALGLEERAAPLLREIEAEIRRAERERKGPRSSVPVFYPIWRKPWMSVNRDTYIHDVLDRAGASNVCADAEARYPELDEQELGELGARVVLLPSEPWEFDETQRAELARSGLFGDAEILCVDGRDFCWHGGRSGAALGRVLDLLLPFRR